MLEADNKLPSIRYLALRDLCDRPPSDPELRSAKAAMLERGVLPTILAKQTDGEGYWGQPADFYTRSKYKGTVWSTIILAECGVAADDPDELDPRIHRACEFLLEWSQDRASGGFAYRGTAEGGGRHDAVLPCLTGNLLWVLARFGYGTAADERFQQAVDWCTTYARFDDGDGDDGDNDDSDDGDNDDGDDGDGAGPPTGWPYEKFKQCWGRHTCMMGIVKIMKGLAALPAAMQTARVRATIDRCASFLLAHRLYQRSHHPGVVANPAWAQLGFPRLWQTDALEMLELLLEPATAAMVAIDAYDDRLHDAWQLLLEKRTADGHWMMERTFNGRFATSIERKGRPSKWLTLLALRMLKMRAAPTITKKEQETGL